MAMEAPPPLYPPSRHDNYSPASATGSDWSGMNNYGNGGLRPDFARPPRGDSMSPSDGEFDPRPPARAQTFASGSPVDGHDRNRGSSGGGSRASSRAASSRASDLSLRDPRSQRSQKAESELRQHYAVLRAYLKGGASQPPRTNKARDKLLRLSPVQFHELSTDVFDELQRRQAAQPLPGRPPRQDKVPPFLQPRLDFHEKRNQARQKLSSLQTSRFRDLSTDVFCELERRFPHFNPDNKRESQRSMSRGGPGGIRSPGMPPPNGFGPPGRAHTTHGSMSSNAGFPPRKQSMATSDSSANSNELGRPMPKQFQSNTITPNKSTMVEDEDDDEDGPIGSYDRSSDAFGLESSLTSPRGSRRDTSATSNTGMSRGMYPPPEEMQQKITDLEQALSRKDEEIKRLSSAAVLKDDLQHKLEQAQDMNKSMEDELQRFRSGGSGDGGDWKIKHQELEQQHQTLKTQLERQTVVTEEVKKQFQTHIAEMRAITDDTVQNLQREEQLHSELQRLREEASEWKARYTKVKTEADHVRHSTIDMNAASSKGLRDQTFYSSSGLVADVHVTQFQLSIDELLSTARTQEPTATLDKISDLVSAVRSITGDVDRVTEGKNDDTSKKYKRSQAKVSATANNVITAASNFAAAYGLSPVSLLDAAASHLTAAVVDLLRIVKVRSSSSAQPVQDGEQHMTPVNKNGYFEVNGHIKRASDANSIYSAISDPPESEARTPVPPQLEQGQMNGSGLGLGMNPALRQDDIELEELKIYLGNQTDLLVQHIQALVNSVRGDQPLPNVRSHADQILDTTDRILATAEGGLEQPTSFQNAFTSTALASYQSLMQARDTLESSIQASNQHEDKPTAREFCQTFPPLAFQLARDAKDLASKIESVTVPDEDFS